MSDISGIGLRGETEFFRRNNNRLLSKQKRIRSIKLKSFHLFLILIIFASAGFAAFKTGEFIMTWEKLRVRSYKLTNSPEFKTQELKKILEKYYVNILSLNFSDLRKELLQLKEVEDVSLSRKLPSTIEIRFFLRKPVFQVEHKQKNKEKGKYKYDIIDREGIVLNVSTKERKDLIVVKDVKKNDLQQILAYLPELNRIRSAIDYVSLKEPFGIMLKLKGRKEIFYPGEDNYAYKINYYLKLRRMQLLEKYRIRCVDLRFENRFYLEFEEEVKS